MNVQKTYRYRLRPDSAMRQMFARFAGSARYLYNWALAARKSAYEESKTTLSYAEQCKLATRLKKAEATAWLSEIHSQVLQQSLKDLDTAYQNTFRRVKKGQTPGFPRFKKKGQKDSFRYPQGVQTAEGKVFLPKIGWVPYCNSDYKGEQPTAENLLQTTVKREGKHWFVSFACEIEHGSQVPFTGSAVGIDVGLKSFAALSDGTVIKNPCFLKKQLRKLKIEQRKLKNKQRGSSNRKKQTARVVGLHTKVKNARKDYAHKASTTIVKNHDIVVIEDLNIKGMVKNHKLARAISDVGWGQFLTMLAYKLKWAGKTLISVNRFFASSQICSCCGAKQPMPLNFRSYDCACGLSIDRDLNAALNIRRQGMSQQLVEGLSSGGSNEARIPRL